MTDIAALENLISEYWCLAYAEGKESRTHDTEDGAAQRKWSEIQAAIRQLAPVPAQGAQYTTDKSTWDRHDRIEFALRDAGFGEPEAAGITEAVEAVLDRRAQGAEGVEALAGKVADWVCEARNTWCATIERAWLEDSESHPDADTFVGDYVARRLRNSPQPVSNGPFGAFYVCPTCSGTGGVTQAVHDDARLRNSSESPNGSFSLLSLIADIRAAAGDPTGKLMQGELVAHIRGLREDAGKVKAIEDELEHAKRVIAKTCQWPNCNCPQSMRTGHLHCERLPIHVIEPSKQDAAIDAARSAGGDDEA